MALSFGMQLEVCDALGKRSILPTHGRPASRWRRRAITRLTVGNKTVFKDNVYRKGCARQFVSQLGALAVREGLKANYRTKAAASVGRLTQDQHVGIVLMSKLAIN